jgi:uncharacterized protein involved in outer membrane biogenesis
MAAAALLQRHRRALVMLVCAAAAILLALLLVLTFGWALLRQPLERHLASRLGRRVSIGSIRRVDRGFFHPELQIDNLHIGQPDWTGGGDMVVVRRARVKLPLLPLLGGRALPSAIDISGLSITLIRRDADHASWKGLPPGDGLPASLRHLGIANGVLMLDDRKRDHHFTARIAADDAGLRIAGGGTLQGRKSTIRLTGPAPAGGPWPFRLDYRSSIANATLLGRADHPLDIGHFGAHAIGWTDDLKHLDLLIEAGLPATQPARLSVDFRRDRAAWTLASLRARVGRSDFAGRLALHKEGDRTKVTGTFASDSLDFDDLASNEGLARAAAKRRLYGPRVIPDTAIHLEHMRHTDAVLSVSVGHLRAARASAVRSAAARFVLDHGVLTAHPLTVRLAKGAVLGWVQVRHPAGAPVLLADLRLNEASLLMPLGNSASGTLAGRLRLRGRGWTIRDAVAHADGRIGLIVHEGAINRRAALFLGSDAGRALLEGKSETTALRCAIGRFVVRRGVASADPLLIDTNVSRADGSGTVDLSDERIALTLTGRPKLANAARLKLPIEITGTLSQPRLLPPKVPRNAGTLLKLIGHALSGDHAAPAPDADCVSLSAQALR